MENLSHSRHPNRSASSLPKKACNGNGGFSYGSGKTANTATTYEDVFGGPPRFGVPTLSPRFEDYCEIFAGSNGSSRAAVSSIPVLDLPLVDDRDVYFDVRSHGFDYREVFGGFDDLDLAPSYEELFMQRSPVGDGNSSDDAWTPEEVESFSGGTEHSGKSPSFSNGRDSYDSIDGSTEFNISYNKASQISDTNMSTGVIRVADLGAIPGYTVAVDEMISAGGTTKLNKKTGPSSVGKGTSRYAFEDKDIAQKYYTGAMSFPSEPFVTVSEIGLKTNPTGIPPPSRPPPVLKSDFRCSASNSRTTGSEGSAGGSSPPFFDVEVDASSAAVREAMVKAEAKLKSAKELFERKRDGGGTTTKRTSTESRMAEEGKSSRTTCLPALENNIEVAKSLREKDRSKSLSSQGSASSNDEWEEATQFVELVRTEQPRNADETSGGKDVSLPPNNDFFDQKLTWAANVDWKKQHRRAKGDWEDHEAKKLLKHSRTRMVSSRHKRHEDRVAEKAPEEPNNEKSRNAELQVEIGNDLPDHGGIVKHRNLLRSEENNLLTEKLAKQKKELQGEAKTLRKAAEKNQERVFDWDQNARKLREALGLADNDSTLEVSLEMKGNGKILGMCGETDVETKLNEALKRMEKETRIKEAHVQEEDDKREREAFEKAETEKRLKIALEQEEKEKKLKESREKEENEGRVAEAREKAEQERKMKEQQESESRLKEAFEKEEKNRRMREAREKAGHERKMEVALEEEKERKIKEAHEKEENEQRMKIAREKAELEQRLKETLEQEKKERRIKEFQEREETERRAKEVLEQAENERRLKDAFEQKEKEKREKEAREKEENEKKLKEAMELEEKEKRLIEAFEKAETERRLKEDLEQEETRMKLQEAKEREQRERMHRENQEHQENEMEQHEYTGEESYEEQRDACEIEKTCETPREAPGEQYLNESRTNPLEEDERVDNHESVKKQREEGPSQRQSMSEEACPWKVFEKNIKDASQKEGASELDVESRLFESNDEAPQLDEDGEPGKESASVTDNTQGGKLEQKSESLESFKNASVLKRDVVMKTEVEERSEGVVVEDKSVRETGVGRDPRNPEESKCAPKASYISRNYEDKYTHHERGSIYETQVGNQDAKLERPLPSQVFMQREKEAERLKRERDFEMERLRKIEEERDREREREKDRMAFDQRALADARERLEKACAEAREKSLPDKLSIEARLRAERAAVERATTEARERAAEKAAFEARERMERSVSDKQFQSSGFFGERMERSVSDKHFQNSASFGASRYQNSSGNDGESPQRYTSRLERHRRTADRVAKALAEKNMRDLVAQREQTERIRIAETLDAEVKRWSSGKEGNIRALLSTLQYILGPESGWQPLPLTEVITSAAVKRAYRKATLCVHPDKLQQRGANIHQKYISEKVFDLLKEAWNRFNSEER